MKETILCMFSGGLDSTALLYVLLTDPKYNEYDIRVHHMRLRNIEHRAQAEDIAVEKILKFFDHPMFKDFTYTENVIETFFLQPPEFDGFMQDIDAMAMIAANMCICDKSITQVVTGVTKTDTATASYLHERRERRAKIFDAMCYLYRENDIEWHSPLIDMTKSEIAAQTPKKLLELSWSCRTPVYADDGTPSECGECFACKELAEMS